MVIRKIMTNNEIYTYATNLLEAFKNIAELKMPVKVHFYFQKNMNALVAMAQELEKERSNIIIKYGTQDPEDPNKVQVDPEHIEDANKELNDLFSLEQEVAINVIELNWFDEINMTPQQVNAITFMIKDEE